MKPSPILSRPPAGPTLPPAPRESIDAILAKNLVVARQAAGVTQHDLAAKALVSRATIAQLETGYSDPRLSTIVDLARALGVPPIFLLLGPQDVEALANLPEAITRRPLPVPPADLERMQRLTRTGMLKDRVRAAAVGTAVARAAGRETPGAVTSAAIFSAILPGPGTQIGVVLGELSAEG
jgi:transcriptional regulator with XRE-family HTH domain